MPLFSILAQTAGQGRGLDLTTDLRQCLRAVYRENISLSDPLVTARIDLLEDGSLRTPPQMLAPPHPGRSEIRMLSKIASVVQACVPARVDGRPVVLAAEFSPVDVRISILADPAGDRARLAEGAGTGTTAKPQAAAPQDGTRLGGATGSNTLALSPTQLGTLFGLELPGAGKDAGALSQDGPRDEKTIIRETQEELNRVGCRAGRPDGVPGRRTKRALRHFLLTTSSAFSEDDLGSEAVLAAIRATSDPVCSLRWVIRNAPLASLGPWAFVSECQLLFRKLKITGTINYKVVDANRITGTIHNSLGQTGYFTATVSGIHISTRINWPRAGIVTTATGTASSKSFAYHGRDSQGCTFSAWKS